jgi:hypothetical protein
VRIQDLTWESPSVRGEMLDVSAGGVCVVLPNEMTLGDTVRVDFSEGMLFGQVIYVNATGEGYRTGIEIFDVLLEKSDLARLVEHALHSDADAIATARED